MPPIYVFGALLEIDVILAVFEMGYHLNILFLFWKISRLPYFYTTYEPFVAWDIFRKPNKYA